MALLFPNNHTQSPPCEKIRTVVFILGIIVLSILLLGGVACSEQPSKATPSSLSTPTETAPIGDPFQRAMWIWNANVARDVGETDKLLDFAQHKGINIFYLYGSDLLQQAPDDLRQFLASAEGIEVELLAGDPSWGLANMHPEALTFIDNAIAFTQNSSDGQQPVGIHLDVEPYLLDSWDTDQPGTITQYLNLLLNVKNKLISGGTPLSLGVDIPFWFDGIEVTYNGATKPLNQHVQDIVDYVVVMDYRDVAEGSDGIITHGGAELQYGSDIGKPVIIGIETNDVQPAKITFFQEGEVALERELSEAKQTFSGVPSFHGFAIHDYVGYSRLSSAPQLVPTPTRGFTTPTVTSHRVSVGQHPPNVVITEVEYSINGEASQMVANEEFVRLKAGDLLTIVGFTYLSIEGEADGQVAAEAYIRKGGAFDYEDGRFTAGTPTTVGEHLGGAFNGGWTVQPSWDRLVIALVHYYGDNYEVDDRFFLNLIVQ